MLPLLLLVGRLGPDFPYLPLRPPWTFVSEAIGFGHKLQTTEKPLGFSVVEHLPKP